VQANDPHNRPSIRSPRYDAPRGGAPLTDRRIEKYILEGRYGERRQRALLEEIAARKQKKQRRTSTRKTLDSILNKALHGR